MYTYFYILNDYGIRPSAVWYLALKKAPFPEAWNKYDPEATTMITYPNGTQSMYGNTNQHIPMMVKDNRGNEIENPNVTMLAWDKTRHSKVDIRLFYAYRDEG